ncbi:MAG: TonB-dependent receptor [Ferruginibacter sp.]|nr:TonB-dependent receptor [Chitinophagaceae bacterium]
MKQLIKAGIHFFLLARFISAGAQETAQHKEDSITRSLNEVVVTAQRSKQKNLLTPYSVVTVSKSYLQEFNPRTTPEALMGTNGVFVQKTNHGGGSPFIRGLTGNQTLILVDGIRMNNSTFRYGPNQYLNTIDAYTINRIEVAKGTGSVQYGTDAIGGVIHVITKDPAFATGKPAFHGKGIGKYMTSHMEKTIRVEAEYATKRFAFTGGISRRSFGDLMGGDTTGKQKFSGYEEWSFDAKARLQLKENIQLTLSNQFLRQENVPVYHKIKLENFAVNEMDPQQRLLSYARLNIKSPSTFFSETEITLSGQQSTEGRNSRKNGSPTLRKEKDITGTAGFTTDVFSQFVKNWTANSGLEFYHDKVNSTRQDINTQTGRAIDQRGLYPDNSKYTNYSFYSLHHFIFNKWIIDAGVRFNTFSIHVTDTSLGDVKISPSAWVGNAGVLYSLHRNHNLYISFSSSYRAPNIDDLGTLGIVDFRYEVPTANLIPEKSQHAELGYKFQTKRVNGTLAAYYMRLDNLITRVKVEGQVISGYPVYKKENTESAYIKGIEAEVNALVMNGWNLAAGIAYSYGENLSKGEPLRRIPPLNGRVMSSWRNKKWFTAAELQFASRQARLAQGDKDDNRIPAGGTPGWEVVNFYCGYRMEKIQLNAGLLNICNEDYRTHGSGINGTGRSIFLTFTLNF